MEDFRQCGQIPEEPGDAGRWGSKLAATGSRPGLPARRNTNSNRLCLRMIHHA